MDKDQPGILTKTEVELIRDTFGGDEGTEFLYQIRNVFLQFPTKKTKVLGANALSVIRKYILPELNHDLPIMSQSDLYFTLDNIKNIPPEVAFLHIKAMDKMVGYIESRFLVLEGQEDTSVTLTSLKERGDKTDEERFTDIIAFQNIVAYLESSFNRLRTVANAKEETVEEREARELANSAK